MKTGKFAVFGVLLLAAVQHAVAANQVRSGDLTVAADGGYYVLRSAGIPGDVLRSAVEVDTGAGILSSAQYPQHEVSVGAFTDPTGPGRGQKMTVTHKGLAGKPELICEFRMYENQSWGTVQVTVHNAGADAVKVHSIRVVKSGSVMNLNGPEEADRVLSDSFSEDTPQLRLMNLGEAEGGLHRGYGSQLVYNSKSGMSLFMGALTADRLLTVFHLKGGKSGQGLFDAENTGTTEALRGQNEQYPESNAVPLWLSVAGGESLRSEPLMFAVGNNYYAQLENYGKAVRDLHHAQVSAPTPIGWWSWTAYYYGVTENNVTANLEWQAQNLLPLGYQYFQIDEGYQYARGEYATPDGKAFPRGVAYVGDEVTKRGITFGVWVAPFEVADRSFVYEQHKDWLVKNLQGEPVRIGRIGQFDNLYVLDTTNPAAQEYLRQTYSTLVKDWHVRFIKMDFMDAAAVEGVRYKPNTTALEALKTGLEIIRDTVGEDVVLDKDGSPMLTPVGLVNAGRISQDTGHTFESTRDAASGIAARYYMNRNFYISDPDAFTVSKQVIPDRVWHGNKEPMSLEDAETSIALSAVSGGMFEIGDDMLVLGADADRLALVKNTDLLDMAKLGKASLPLDLMTYRAEDKQPSIFLLKEDAGQRILTVFNWTEERQTHAFDRKTLGLKAEGSYAATDVLRGGSVALGKDGISMTLAPHTVRMVKLVDTAAGSTGPAFEMHVPVAGTSGGTVEVTASAAGADAAVLGYRWNFGDGVSAEGSSVRHSYTQPGKYTITATAIGLNGRTANKKTEISITGMIPTAYNPAIKERYTSEKR